MSGSATAALWQFDAFLDGVDGTLIGAMPGSVTGISIDSRTVAAGDAFFAIQGDRFDGHDFVRAALDAGAGVAVVSTAWLDKQDGLPGALVAVDDPLAALERLGTAARARSGAKIIAVTGSVGKTSTKEMLRLALAPSGATHASVASFNNHWGVPLTLARMPETAKFAVFEIGMNHPGEITPLVGMVRPDVAIVTTVAPVHLEFFRNVEEIADAKAEIFSGIVAGGAAILNGDNPLYDRLAERAAAAGVARVLQFGSSAAADAALTEVALKEDCACVTARIAGREVAYKIGAPGRHLVDNSLAVLLAADLVGADLALAALALTGFQAQKGRGARLKLVFGDGLITVIDESYNANPASMRAALTLLGAAELGKGGRRIAVLGDMLELGANSADLHRGLADPIAEQNIDKVYLAGPMMAALWQALPGNRRGAYASSSADLESGLIEDLKPGDAVMVKGSLGSKMGPIVEALKRRFPAAGGGAAAAE